MFGRTKNILKYSAYFVVILAVILVYSDYREQINVILPVENFVFGIWPAFKGFIEYFDVVPEYIPTPEEVYEVFRALTQKEYRETQLKILKEILKK